ncbi:hypothetical protein FYK55_27260 [Roseiconus nitratireducens]|uniref:Uncharacterized protein n=1 Tax=Roseiconus nitratireducens TaxID=2605748 RepID=A0A5M6CZ51_9BACT|nr:hypothetical protein [Roseiconus nitratireducens]KAA5538589.1 hypothetical protein FYK55_27260 [Roseiconus nitratireducens]
MVLKAIAFLVGVSVFFVNISVEPIPFVVAAATLASELAAYRMERVRGIGQGLRRKIEMQDGFGWEISGRELSDLVARCSRSVKSGARKFESDEPYFASKESPGAKRGVENVMESAWWSKHLSETMLWICITVIGLAILGSIAALVVSILTITSQVNLVAISRIVTSVLLLGLSLGLLRLAIGYFAFSARAEEIEKRAESLLNEKKLNQTESIKLVHEYQLARASAPIIPEWIWKWRRKELNELWCEFRQRPEAQA